MKKKTVCAVLCILSGAVTAILGGTFALAAVFAPAEAASVGIIGGADGPTTIFVTGQLFRRFYILLPAGVFVVSGILWLVLHLHSRKHRA